MILQHLDCSRIVIADELAVASAASERGFHGVFKRDTDTYTLFADEEAVTFLKLELGSELFESFLFAASDERVELVWL